MNSDESEIDISAKVKEVLMQEISGPSLQKIKKAVDGSINWDRLDADDWLEVIHVTDGEICLRFDDTDQDKTWYVSTGESGEYYGVASGGVPSWDSTILAIKSDLNTPHYRVQPTHRCETPLKEALSNKMELTDTMVSNVTVFQKTQDGNKLSEGDRFVIPGENRDEMYGTKDGKRQECTVIAQPIAVIDIGAKLHPENLSKWGGSDAGQAVLSAYIDSIDATPPILPSAEEFVDEHPDYE